MGDEFAVKSEVIILITLNLLPQALMLVQGASVAGICLAMAADEFLRPALARELASPLMALLTAKQQSRRLRVCTQSQSGMHGASRGRLSAGDASARVRHNVRVPSRLVASQPPAAFYSTLHVPQRLLAAGQEL
jgi:hypothetical protein